jgi:hypothetical protein
MSTGGDRVGAEALCSGLQDACDLLAGHVELLHDLLDTEGLEVLDDCRKGSRVPLNTQAPLTLPGMLSTTGHWDQSSAAMV